MQIDQSAWLKKSLARWCPHLNWGVVLRRAVRPLDGELWANLTELERQAKPPENARPERLLEWAEGRRALREAVCQMGPAGETAATSLSHSQGWVLAVAAHPGVSRGLPLAVGVDFEQTSREFGPELVARVLTPDESRLAPVGIPRIALWVIKEAAFKSDLGNHGRVLSHYVLREIKANPDGSLLARLNGPNGLEIQVFATVLEDWYAAVALAGMSA